MIDPRYGLAAVAYLSGYRCRRDPHARPVAFALGTLALIDGARLYHPPPQIDAALWMLWPGVAATLAVWAWRTRRASAWAWRAFNAYAALALLPRWPWTTHPRAWTVALWTPHVAGLLVAGVAWWRWKDEGPGTVKPRARDHASMGGAQPIKPPAEGPSSPTPSRTLAQQVAGILALSSAVDLLVGAGAPGVGYEYAAPLAWATWAAIGWVLVR